MPTNAVRPLRHVLVTGGAGFIGSAFIRHLLSDAAFEGLCVNYDLLTYAGNLANVDSVADDPRYRFVQGDIGDERLLEEVCRNHAIDTIVHFAAESHVDRSIVDPEAFLRTNILGTYHLLQVTRRLPHIHFHHVSTDEVYGCLGDSGSFSETTPYDPRSPYSASKAASDHLVRAYGNTYGLSYTISNCSNNYGPYQFPEKLIPLMILRCQQRQPLPVYGDGGNVRDWLHVDDHARALWLILQRGAAGETYNIGGSSERRNLEIVHLIIDQVAAQTHCDAAVLRSLITFVGDRPGHDWRYAIDSAKIARSLGWQPRYSLDQGIADTVAWYLANGPWIDNVVSGAYRHWVAQNYASR